MQGISLNSLNEGFDTAYQSLCYNNRSRKPAHYQQSRGQTLTSGVYTE